MFWLFFLVLVFSKKLGDRVFRFVRLFSLLEGAIALKSIALDNITMKLNI